MNVVLAAFLLSIGFMVGFPTVLNSSNVQSAHNIRFEVVAVAHNSPADTAGLAEGDSILTVDGQTFATVPDFQAYIAQHSTTPVTVSYQRSGAVSTTEVLPQALPETNGRPVLGVSLLQTGTIRYPIHQALIRGVAETWRLGREILVAFGGLFSNLIVKHEVPADVAGPVGIAVLTGQVARLGIIYLLQFAALLSLNLAIINVLPFPALDGGRLLFVVIEKMRRKPNNERVEALVHQIGFTILIALVLLVTYQDVVRLSGGFFSNLWGS
jgi:regulator of sigma E protease